MLDSAWDWIQHPGVSILVILLVGWLGRHFGGAVIERTIRRFVRSSYFHELSDDDVRKRQNTLIGLFTAIWKSIVVVVVALLVFRQLFPSIDLTPVFASAGIIGIALGFGAQSVIKDFLSGVFIILENQYRVGDVVDIEGAAGTVERISIRSTVLRDADGNVHYLPNGSVVHVINKTMGYSRVNFTLAVDPTTNIDELSDIINRVGEKLAKDDAWKDKVLEPPHFLSIGTFSDLALEVKITGKTQPSAQWSVTGELRKRLLATFKKHGVELASLPTGVPQLSKKR
jgi:small conductance mechanosensitive channel